MRYLPSGQPVTNFSVASNRKWTDNEGVLHEETIWIRASAFGRLAEVTNQYLSKGRQVYMEGRLRPDPETGGPRVYERNDGSHGSSYEIVATTVQFLTHAEQGTPSEGRVTWRSLCLRTGRIGGEPRGLGNASTTREAGQQAQIGVRRLLSMQGYRG